MDFIKANKPESLGTRDGYISWRVVSTSFVICFALYFHLGMKHRGRGMVIATQISVASSIPCLEGFLGKG